MAVRRCAAWRQTSECGPSSTSSVISSPRCAGRQCSTTASAGGPVDQRRVDGEAFEGGQALRPLLLLAHARPDVGVEDGGILGRLARVVGPCTVPPRPTRSPKACSSASSSPENE